MVTIIIIVIAFKGLNGIKLIHLKSQIQNYRGNQIK